MALYIGDTLISGTVEGQQLNLPFSLFEYQFTDHLLNNASWLRADTFSWQSGAVYVSAYGKLVEEYATGTTQTEDGITYKLTTNGLKIAEADQESAIASLFNTTGKAWFYILDTANQRFKLPRELPFDGQAKGNGMTLGLTDGTQTGSPTQTLTNGVNAVTIKTNLYGQNIGVAQSSGNNMSNGLSIGITTDPTKSGIILNRDNTDSQKYLYFYVGETVQDANLINAGAVLDALDDKVDIDLNNCTKPYITETYVNGTSWYRVYSDGWCEQGGQIIGTTSGTLTYLKPYQDTNYTIFMHAVGTYAGSVTGSGLFNPQTRTASSCTYYQDGNANTMMWQACGYTA